MTTVDRPLEAETPPLLTGQVRALQAGRRSLHWFALLLPPVLVGYAFFDKGFAYLHVPGVPLYLGEVLVAVGLLAAVAGTAFIARALQFSTLAKLLIAFSVWGVVGTWAHLLINPLDAARDAAIWYYSLLAIPVAALVLSQETQLQRWANAYRRIVPWLLVYSPLAVFLANAGGNGLPPRVPDSAITFWVHKPGNIAVHVTIAVAFLWLVPGGSRRSRTVLTVVATVGLALIATQSRSGFVAAVAGLALVWVFSRRRGRMALTFIATVLALLLLGWAVNVRIAGEQNRTVSTGQLIENVKSLGGSEPTTSQGNLESNVEFRNQLWSGVINLVRGERRLLVGVGFGRNLAKELGFEGEIPGELRSPHNSHLNIFARMGLIGAALWIAIWITFYRTTLRARRRLRRLGMRLETGLLEVAIVGVTATLVNAYFDPTLEGPQVAVWLWSLVGVGLGIVGLARRAGAVTTSATSR